MIASKEITMDGNGEMPQHREQSEPHESYDATATQMTFSSDVEANHEGHITDLGDRASVPEATHSVQMSSKTNTDSVEQAPAAAATTSPSPNHPDPSYSTYVRRNTMDGTLVITTLQLLTAAVENERIVHTLAAAHYKALYDWVLFLPSILLMLVGGILAFVAQDDSGLKINESQSTLLSTIVGILSLVSVFWQSLTKQLNLGGRAMLHESAAVALEHIVEDLPFRQLDPNFSVQETRTYLKQTNEKFTQALASCTSMAPLRITSSCYEIRSALDLHLTLYNNDVCKEFDLKRGEIYLAGSAEINAIFCNYLLFPFVLPSSAYVTKKVLINLQDTFKVARDAGPES